MKVTQIFLKTYVVQRKITYFSLIFITVTTVVSGYYDNCLGSR